MPTGRIYLALLRALGSSDKMEAKASKSRAFAL